MDVGTIHNILRDWRFNDLTHGQIKWKYRLTDEVEFAITEASKGLSDATIAKRLEKIKKGMRGDEIRIIMASDS